MGNFYTNITLVDVEQEPVVSFFHEQDRTAVITPCVNGITVVLDAESESQDQEVLLSLAAQLSETFTKPALAVLNHDDDALMYWLYTEGKMKASYNSMTLFYNGEEEHESVDANAEKLAVAFGAEQSVEKVKFVLKAPGASAEGYIFALDRHRDLLEALGLPTFAAGLGFNYLEKGAVPGEIDQNKLVRITKKGKTGKKPVKKERSPKDKALIEAVMDGKVDKVKSLIESGADVNARDMGGPAILHAVACQDPTPEEATAIVRLLIDAGADVNARGFEGMTALHEAARAGYTDAVRALLDAGAKVNSRGSFGETALDIAEEEGHEEIIQMLEQARPKGKKRKTRDQVMRDAIMKGKREAMKLSQQFKDQAEAFKANKGAWKESAKVFTLVMAARTNNLKALEQVIAEGVDVNAPDNATGLSALMIAGQEGYREIAEALLKAGADKDVKTREGKTALDFALEKGHQDVAALLKR